MASELHSFIVQIIQKFGGRLGGSQAEADAQRFVAEELKKFAPNVQHEPFEAALWAMFQVLRPVCVLYLAGLALFPFSNAAGLVVSLLAAVPFVSQFLMYRRWFDFLFPKYQSSNVIATLEPEGEARATLVVAGHIDSAKEFIWWYWFKKLSLILMIVQGLLIVLGQPLLHAVALATGKGFSPDFNAITLMWAVFVGLSPLLLQLFFIHGKNVVPGAQDNLSGVTIGFHTLKTLAQGQPLKHLRVRFISFGCEEGGLRGSEAYVKKHFEELKRENVLLVNLDGILDPENLHIITQEISFPVAYDKKDIERVEKAFIEEQIPYKKGIIPFGGTDGASFKRKGLSAVTLVGFDIDHLHPTYHTRLDVPEFVQPESLERTRRVLVRLAKDWDEELLQAK